jgi:glutaredoxin 3
MKPVRIYTTPICPYCVRAKSLLKKKGVEVEEVAHACCVQHA